MEKFEILQELQNMTRKHEASKCSRENGSNRLPGHVVAPICEKCNLCKGKEAVKAKHNKTRFACTSEPAFRNAFQSICSSSTYSVLETNPWCCWLRSSNATKTHINIQTTRKKVWKIYMQCECQQGKFRKGWKNWIWKKGILKWTLQRFAGMRTDLWVCVRLVLSSLQGDLYRMTRKTCYLWSWSEGQRLQRLFPWLQGGDTQV